MRLDIIPIGILFTFDVSSKTASQRVVFYRKLYGCSPTSWAKDKKYKYKRKGLLSDVKHLKPTQSTLIVTMKDAQMLRTFFRKNKIKFSENAVMLQEAQARKLKVVSPSAWVNIYKELLGKEDTIMGIDW